MGKIRLFWCDTCNVPRVKESSCGICGDKSRKISISPPGDPFPAMEGHLKRAVDAIDSHFGEGVGAQLLSSKKTIVMNKVSALDAMYEFVVDGYLVGRLRFELDVLDYRFLLTLEGARRVGLVSKEKWVSCYEGILKYLIDGANLMLPGVAGCDSGIEVGDEVWVLDHNGDVIASGIARMSGTDMARESKGFAVKIREVGDPNPPKVNDCEATWDDAVRANIKDLSIIEEEACKFVKRVVTREDLPVVVGFSGGKDSLSTYLVVEEALGKSPTIFFVNTGIELPETVHYIKDFAKTKGVRIIGYDAGERFWEAIDDFGPPARDFRWCCKVLKLGPASQTIAEQLGGEVVSFMGQRKLESFTRSVEPRVTTNPWVPGQLSANPIQNWNALEVWLYIFSKEVPFNPLYTKGYHRMGCYLCPSSPMVEFYALEETHPNLFQRWNAKLVEWADRLGLPDEWVEHGFWRWKELTPGQKKLVKKLGLDIKTSRESPAQKLELNITKGVSPCVSSGYSLEGQFSSGIDLARVAEIMPIFGKTKVSDEFGAVRVKTQVNDVTLFSSGSLVVRGEDSLQIEKLVEKIQRAVKRALYCQACGTCIPQCDNNALYLKEGKVAVAEKKCTNCLKCDSWPCPTYLS